MDALFDFQYCTSAFYLRLLIADVPLWLALLDMQYIGFISNLLVVTLKLDRSE